MEKESFSMIMFIWILQNIFSINNIKKGKKIERKFEPDIILIHEISHFLNINKKKMGLRKNFVTNFLQVNMER